MAKGKKTGGKDFVKGDPRAGRPAMSTELKKANKLTSLELKRILNRLLFMTDTEIALLAGDESANQLERIVAAIIGRAVDEGDHSSMEWLAARLVGKVAEKVEVKTEPFIVKRASGEQVVMGSKQEEED